MEIKPMFDQTIKMNVQSLSLNSAPASKIKNETEIPNGIYKVIRWEKMRQWLTIGLNIALVLTAAILFSLYYTTMHVSWIAYVIPLTLFLLSSWKLFTTLIERSRLVKDVTRYREDLKVGLTSTPPFIARMYRSLHAKQVAHNWFTIFILFYGGILTLLLWWLKDVSWWILDFKTWINNMFSSPTVMAWLFTVFLILVSVIHIFFSIQRNKRIVDINSYFGATLGSESDIQAIKTEKNKMYRRLFILSIMIILVIPLLVRFILKRGRGKK